MVHFGKHVSERKRLGILRDLPPPARVHAVESFGGGIDNPKTVTQLLGKHAGKVVAAVGLRVQGRFRLKKGDGLFDVPDLALDESHSCQCKKEGEERISERGARRESARDDDERRSVRLRESRCCSPRRDAENLRFPLDGSAMGSVRFLGVAGIAGDDHQCFRADKPGECIGPVHEEGDLQFVREVAAEKIPGDRRSTEAAQDDLFDPFGPERDRCGGADGDCFTHLGRKIPDQVIHSAGINSTDLFRCHGGTPLSDCSSKGISGNLSRMTDQR